MLSALFDKWDDVTKAQEIAATSAGVAKDRYEIFLDSINASAANMKASWEAVWQKTINSDAIKFFYDMSAGVGDLVSSMGGLIPIVLSLAGAFVVLNFTNIAAGIGTAIKSVQTFMVTLRIAAAATAGEIAVATAGISLLIGAVIWVVSSLVTGTKQLENQIKTINESIASTTQEISDLESKENVIKNLGKEYLELKNNTEKSTEEQRRFNEVQERLKELLPEIAGYYDQAGNFVISETAITSNQEYVNLLQNQVDLKKELLALDVISLIDSEAEAYAKRQEKIADSSNLLNMAQTAKEGEFTGWGAYEAGRYAGLDTTKIQKEIALLKSENAEAVQNIVDGWKYLTTEQQEEQKKQLANMGDFGQQVIDVLEGTAEAVASSPPIIPDPEAQIAAIESLINAMDAVTAAQKEQIDNGYVSTQTAIELISANASLAQYLTQTANGYLFDAEAARQATYQEMLNAFTKYDIASAAVAAANGNYVFAMSAIAAANATKEEKEEMIGLLNAFAAMGAPVVSGFSGGGGGAAASQQVNVDAQEAEIDAINEQIDALHDQQDALKDLLKAYKDIIDAQKEKLRLAKEEDDYQKSLEEKNKELVDIDNELLALQFDNSQEANQKRLELEELRAEKAEEIAELQADRTYDIQMEALDAEYAAYEEWINNQLEGIDRLIEGFNAMIEAIRDVIEALQDMNNQSGGGYGGSSGTSSSSSLPLPPRPGQTGGGSGSGSGGFIYGSGGAISNNSLIEEGFSKGGMGIIPDGHPNDSFPLMAESGEMFMIFNKQQQQQLARGARIPNMGIGVANSGTSSAGITVGDISISVAGNLDKVALGDIKTAVFDVLNSASNQRGKRANALTYSL